MITDNIFSFNLLNSVAGSMNQTVDTAKFGTYGVLVLAAGPSAGSPVPADKQDTNTNGNGTSTYTPDDGYFNFALTQNAGGLDTSNFMVLYNDKNGAYRIHLNENGSSMNGKYVLDVTGKVGSTFAAFKQQFVYGTVGNDITYTITAQDSDTTSVGLSAKDVTVNWSTMKQADVTSTDVYILPTATTLDTNTHLALTGTITTGTVNAFQGATGSNDSAAAALVAGEYKVYVVNKDTSGAILETLSVNNYLTDEL